LTLSQRLKLDEIDRKIIKFVQENPNLTHDEIASRINRSQPTIGLRLKKLKEKDVFYIQPGINFKNANLTLGMVKIRTSKPEVVLQMSLECPFVVNAFMVSGDYNVCLLLLAPNLKYFEEIINKHFRKTFHKVKTEIIIDTAKDFVLPVNFKQLEKHNPLKPEECIEECVFCKKEFSEI
jgi:DNA-binding Lrp family transcriptional regulator